MYISHLAAIPILFQVTKLSTFLLLAVACPQPFDPALNLNSLTLPWPEEDHANGLCYCVRALC